MNRLRCHWPSILLGLFIAGGCVGLLAVPRWPLRAQDSPPVAASAPAKGPAVRALGRLEPQSGIISIGARPGSRVLQLPVKQGQKVDKDQVLAVLEGHEQAQQQLALAVAQQRQAVHHRHLRRQEAQLERERFDQLCDARLARLHELVDLQAENRQLARDSRDKIKTLAVESTRVALQDFSINRAQAELLEAKNRLEEFEASLRLLDRQRHLQDEQLADGGPDDEVLAQQIQLAKANLEAMIIRAPVAGTILELVAHAGETSTGTVLFLANLDSMVVIAEVFQSDVLAIRVGDHAEIDILGQNTPGVVTAIGTLIGKNQATSLDPTALADRRVAKVWIRLDECDVARKLNNMQVDVTVFPGSGASP